MSELVEVRGKIGKAVAFCVSGTDALSVAMEAMCYAEQYREDGDVLMQQKINGRWKRSGKVSQQP